MDKPTVASYLMSDAEAGRKVQRHFMPPESAEYEQYGLAYRIHSKMPISGDFIDHTHLGDGLALFVVLDVSGHGAGAGLIGLMASQWVRHALMDCCMSPKVSASDWPALILKSVNRALLRADTPCHVTGVIGILDLWQHQLHYAIAGHHPLPVMIGSQGAHLLSGTGKPIGLFREANWQNQSVSMNCGQHLAVLTDGIWPFIAGSSTLEKEGYLLDWLATELMGGSPLAKVSHLHNRVMSSFERLILSRARSRADGTEREGGTLTELDSMKLKEQSSALPYPLLDDDLSLLVISRGE